MDENKEKDISYCGWESADENEENFITLEFDDGECVECEILGVFDHEGKEYIALIPEEGSDDVYLYGYKEVDNEEFELIDIVDDEEFEKVAEAFERTSAEEVARMGDYMEDERAEDGAFEAAAHEFNAEKQTSEDDDIKLIH